jgi:hypothetical protein
MISKCLFSPKTIEKLRSNTHHVLAELFEQLGPHVAKQPQSKIMPVKKEQVPCTKGDGVCERRWLEEGAPDPRWFAPASAPAAAVPSSSSIVGSRHFIFRFYFTTSGLYCLKFFPDYFHLNIKQVLLTICNIISGSALPPISGSALAPASYGVKIFFFDAVLQIIIRKLNLSIYV